MEAGVRPERNSGGGANDALLLGRVGSKDVQAFEELYRRYRTRLTRFLIKLIHRPTLVEDVLNETFIVIWDRAHTFNGASKVSTWIFAIAYRKPLPIERR
jgi:RNA polymerase sigma-70 factor (ECF subfamily)